MDIISPVYRYSSLLHTPPPRLFTLFTLSTRPTITTIERLLLHSNAQNINRLSSNHTPPSGLRPPPCLRPPPKWSVQTTPDPYLLPPAHTETIDRRRPEQDRSGIVGRCAAGYTGVASSIPSIGDVCRCETVGPLRCAHRSSVQDQNRNPDATDSTQP